MTLGTKISERLLDAAESEEKSVASTFSAVARKLDSYSRGPGKRKDADKLVALLTVPLVNELGSAFVDVWTPTLDGAEEMSFSNAAQGNYVMVSLLAAAGIPELQASARPWLAELKTMIPRLVPRQAEQVYYFAGLFPEIPEAVDLEATALARLDLEPESLAEEWSRELGLELGRKYWSVTLSIKPEYPDGHPDAVILVDVTNLHGNPSQWNIRIGALNMSYLGVHHFTHHYRGFSLGQYERDIIGSDEVLEGQLEPAQSPLELPRILSDLEKAHPGLKYDRVKFSASGRPGRLMTPARKKILAAWLSQEA